MTPERQNLERSAMPAQAIKRPFFRSQRLDGRKQIASVNFLPPVWVAAGPTLSHVISSTLVFGS